MRNVSVMGEIWLGACPSEPDLELASRRGVAVVLDLSWPSEAPAYDVELACRRLGIDYRRARVADRELPSDETVDQVLGVLAECADEPTLLFCGTGGRCAMFLAIHRATELGVPLEVALTEARHAGMLPDREAFVRRQAARLGGAR
jgi:uncharacterized protein (TIGR01244 family)